MTESDLRDARSRMDERIDGARQQGRRRTIVAAAAAAVVVTVVSLTALQNLGGDNDSAPPASPPTSDPDADFLTGNAPTPELLEGTWRVDNGSTSLRFTPDGKVFLDENGRLYADSVVGRYTIGGDLITVEVEGGPAGCVPPQQLVMRASQPAAGLLHLVHTQPITGDCLSGRSRHWILEQILPTSDGWSTADFSGEDFRPLADPSALHGDWLAQGGGHVLELTSDATPSDTEGVYYVAAESGAVVDHGRWSLNASHSQLRLVSSGHSKTCEAGDRLVLGEVALADSNPSASFRGTVQQNTCNGAWTPIVWILIPHMGS